MKRKRKRSFLLDRISDLIFDIKYLVDLVESTTTNDDEDDDEWIWSMRSIHWDEEREKERKKRQNNDWW